MGHTADPRAVCSTVCSTVCLGFFFSSRAEIPPPAGMGSIVGLCPIPAVGWHPEVSPYPGGGGKQSSMHTVTVYKSLFDAFLTLVLAVGAGQLQAPSGSVTANLTKRTERKK